MNAETVDDEERRVLGHLARASEALKSDRLDEAEREVTAAMALRAEDVRARNLLGLVLFRAQRYAQAREVYTELGQKYPDDVALRLNLGLVELRMERYHDAATNLKRVVELEPNNTRAQGYLGLALVRTGDLEGARDAFARGQQPELARQVSEKMTQANNSSFAASLASAAGVREAAADGRAALEGPEQPFGAVELEPPLEEARRLGTWQVRVPGAEVPLPDGNNGSGPLGLTLPRPVSAFATARLLSPGAETFGVSEGGMLIAKVDGKLPTRTLGAIASTGSLSFEPLFRRVRAQATDEPFGEGAEAMFVASGQGLMVVAPRGGRFTLLGLNDDILYVREPVVFAFEDSLSWENGRVPGSAARSGEDAGGDRNRVAQFRGQGRVVLRSQRASYTLKIDPEQPLFVDASCLLGWIGRVVPRVMHGDNGEPTPYVECSGEGVLVLEEPPAL